MAGVVVVGSQWGDEGKGKITWITWLKKQISLLDIKVVIMPGIQLNLMVKSLLYV